MDALGIAGIHQRIAQVEARFIMPASVAPMRAVAGATAVGEKSFAGVDIGVTDSYRSYDAQVDVARRKGCTARAVWRRRPEPAITAGA